MKVRYFRLWAIFWVIALVIWPAGGAAAAQHSLIAGGSNFSLAIAPNGSLWSWGANGLGELGQGDTIERHRPTRVGADLIWVAVSAQLGGHHVLALRANGSLWAWGCGADGKLCLGDTIKRNLPTQGGSATNWQAVVAGGPFYSLGRWGNGSLLAWGENNSIGA